MLGMMFLGRGDKEYAFCFIVVVFYKVSLLQAHNSSFLYHSSKLANLDYSRRLIFYYCELFDDHIEIFVERHSVYLRLQVDRQETITHCCNNESDKTQPY